MDNVNAVTTVTKVTINIAAKVATIMFLLGSLSGCYLTSAGMHDKPGYADISFPHFRFTDNTFNLSLGPNIVQPIRDEIIKNNQEHQALLKGVEAIRVRIFDASEGRKHLERSIDRSISNLRDSGWQTLIAINDGLDRFAVQTNTSSGTIHGISVFAINESDAFFFNLMGDFDEKSLHAWSEKMKEMDSGERQASLNID